jgi:diguanylate cyclase (GGDEF)-like protein
MVSSLVEVSRFRRAIESDETEHDIYRRFGDLLRDVFGIDRFCIYEVDASMNRIRLASIDSEIQRDVCFCDSRILEQPDRCRVRRAGHAMDGFVSDEKCASYNGPDGYEHLCIPFHQSDEVGGILQLIVDESERKRINPQRPIIEAYLREAGAVIEIKRQLGQLRESSLRDPLTGLYNRRFLAEFETTLVATIKRRLTHAVVLMLDMDHFKEINDGYGHETGDSMLRALSKTLLASVRSSDLVIRYGGEEFMLILMDAGAENGIWVAEKIRTNIENMCIEHPAGRLQRTVSIGVADFPADSDDFWECVKYADNALYRAKETGRNRVERYVAEIMKRAESY